MCLKVSLFRAVVNLNLYSTVIGIIFVLKSHQIGFLKCNRNMLKPKKNVSDIEFQLWNYLVMI